MSPLDPLAPDQRAVVALVLQQGRSYDEIAALLGIAGAAVRSRAHAGLAALAPGNGLPGEITGPLADYLLGQQGDADAEATRGLLAESAPARAWATEVAAQLADVAPGALPPIPSGDAAGEPALPPPAAAPRPRPARDADNGERTAAPRPRPAREAEQEERGAAPPASSKLGGILLIAAVLAVVGVVLFLVLRGDDDGGSGDEVASGNTPTATATPTATPAAKVTDDIRLRAPGGGKAKGTMAVLLQGDQLLFQLQAQEVPQRRIGYGVWLTGPGNKARLLGFTSEVGKDGQLGIQGPGSNDLQAFPELYATHENIVVSRDVDANPKRPREVILTGKLPAGR